MIAANLIEFHKKSLLQRAYYKNVIHKNEQAPSHNFSVSIKIYSPSYKNNRKLKIQLQKEVKLIFLKENKYSEI